MTGLHAPDAMGEAAHEAAMAVHLLDYRLLCASSATLTRQQRADALRKALRQWPILCRAMGKLAMASPATSSQSDLEDQQMRDWIDGRAESAA